MSKLEPLRFLSKDQVRELAKQGTPLFVYSRTELVNQAKRALTFEAPFGLRVLYAMKANPHPEVVKTLYQAGIGIDASSSYEAEIAIEAGVDPKDIQLTSQRLPDNLRELLDKGVAFTACSLHQLEEYGKVAPGTSLGVRINPGIGDGLNNRLTTGGPNASFGIWHEYTNQIKELVVKFDLQIDLIHTHIGAVTRPEAGLKAAKINMSLLKQFPDATRTSIGGGFKIAYMQGDEEADMAAISAPIAKLLKDFAIETGREIELEIEPGRYLSAYAGTLISKIVDSKDTGANGHKFLILDSGMTDFLRSAMYGAQHPLITVAANGDDNIDTEKYGVSGHCCESADMFTMVKGDPESLETRLLQKAEIGDYLCTEAAGAYCANMRATGYNSFPIAKEILID